MLSSLCKGFGKLLSIQLYFLEGKKKKKKKLELNIQT